MSKLIDAGRKSAGGNSYVVAASNAPLAVQRRADAVCTGTADETIINAFLLLGSVQLTDGDYWVTTPILMTKPGSQLRGSGYGEDMGSEGGRGFGTLIEVHASFTGAAAIICNQTNRPAGQSVIENLSIDGNSVGTVDGIKFYSFQGRLNAIDIRYMGGNGFHILGYSGGEGGGAVAWSTYDTHMSHLHAASCGGAGMYLGVAAADLHLNDSTFNSNVVGLKIVGGASAQISNVHCYESSLYGIHFFGGGSRTKFTNCKVEHSWKHGLFFDGSVTGTTGVQFTGGGFNCNGKINLGGTGGGGGNLWSHVSFSGANSHTGVIMTGVVFGNSDGVANLAKYCIDLDGSGGTHSIVATGLQMGSTIASAGVGTARVALGNASIRAASKFMSCKGYWDMVGGSAPVATYSSGAGTGPPTSPVLVGTDQSGSVTWGTGTSPAASQQVTVTFAIPQEMSGGGKVVVTPFTAATVALGMYVLAADSTTALFKVSVATAPAASQANTVYGFIYQVAT